MPAGFPPDCKLPPELKNKVLTTNQSRRQHGTCGWCSKLSVTKPYRTLCGRTATVVR